MLEIPAVDTGERILDAAEHLFMAHGYEGTSMRQITSGAGVNLAAVNYHFGSKERLMQAVFCRRLDWLNEERIRVLDAMELAADGQALQVSQIVDGFFGTLLRMAEDPQHGGMTFLRLLGRTLTEPSKSILSFLAREYATVVDRYTQALFKALPELPREEIIWRFHFMLGASSYAIAGTDALGLIAEGDIAPADAVGRLDHLVSRLLAFLLGGLGAPLPVLAAATVDRT